MSLKPLETKIKEETLTYSCLSSHSWTFLIFIFMVLFNPFPLHIGLHIGVQWVWCVCTHSHVHAFVIRLISLQSASPMPRGCWEFVTDLGARLFGRSNKRGKMGYWKGSWILIVVLSFALGREADLLNICCLSVLVYQFQSKYNPALSRSSVQFEFDSFSFQILPGYLSICKHHLKSLYRMDLLCNHSHCTWFCREVARCFWCFCGGSWSFSSS